MNANRELIQRMQARIDATLARVWGEEQPATADVVELDPAGAEAVALTSAP